MTRRTQLHALALGVILAATVPLLALLCRGHTPAQYAIANLPPWERHPPTPAPVRVSFRFAPAAPGAILFTDPKGRYPSWWKRLLSTNEDSLLAGLERPAPRGRASNAGRAGAWLEAACALGRMDIRLAAKQDRVVTRLLNGQDRMGYLGGPPRAHSGNTQAQETHDWSAPS